VPGTEVTTELQKADETIEKYWDLSKQPSNINKKVSFIEKKGILQTVTNAEMRLDYTSTPSNALEIETARFINGARYTPRRSYRSSENTGSGD